MNPRLLAATLFASLALSIARAADFVPPEAYPQDRYEQGWQKNPFTLKTAPQVVQHDSFAKDLALSSISGSEDKPTVILINTKTRERTVLRNGGDDKTGMTIKAIHSDGGRKECYVDVELAGEVASIHFDEKVIAASAVPTPAMPNNGGNRPGIQPGGVRMGVPGAPGGGPANVNPANGGMNGAINGIQPGSAASMANPANRNMPQTTAQATPPSTGLPPGVNIPVVPGQQTLAAPSDSAPIVQRRRFMNVPQPAVPGS